MSVFTDLSKNIVCDFLHNVILADDRIEFNSGALPSAIVMPTRENIADSSKTPEINISEKAINVKPILDEFVAKGIPCSFLTLNNTEQPELYIKNLKKSDALILDWQVDSDEGEFILQVLEKLFKDDANSLRVILIYTGFTDLKSIIKKITDTFPEIPFVTESTHGCSIQNGSTIISVYAKTKLSVDPALAYRFVDEKQLVEALITEFTSITSGLVSNVALKSISVIRENTHKLLSLFNKDLDPAFLAHRGSLPVVDDAGDLLKESIVNSIKAILDYNYIEKDCSFKPIAQWINSFEFSVKEIQINKKDKLKLSKSEIIKWQKDGFPKMLKEIWGIQLPGIIYEEKKNKNLFNDIHKSALSYFLPVEIENNYLEEKFSILTHHKSNYANPSYTPRLTLGTIIQGQNSKKYWLCVQQKCDSVRLEGKPRRFLFLPLENCEGNQIFNFIIPTDASFQKVKVNNETHSLRTIKFTGNIDGSVHARKYGKSKKYIFTQYYKDKKKDENFIWVLDLKDAHAQRIANAYAAKLSRVGLDESEWLRRWSGN